MQQDWSIYLIRCANGSLYTGITTDVERRLAEHREGGIKGAKYLKGKGPLTLAWHQLIGSRSDALKMELKVKRLPKADKESLVKNQLKLCTD